jgi:hypothetical protein
MKPATKKQLKTLLSDIQENHKRLLEKKEDYAYAICAIGLSLIKVRNGLAPQEHTEDGTFASIDHTFKDWLEDHFPAISKSTAHNYMNAVANAFYIHEGKPEYFDPEAIAGYDEFKLTELREAHTLHGVSISKTLYKTPPHKDLLTGTGDGESDGGDGAGEDDQEDELVATARQCWFPYFDTLMTNVTTHKESLWHLPDHGDPEKGEVGLLDIEVQTKALLKDIQQVKRQRARKK